MNGLFLEVLIASFLGRPQTIAKIPGDIVWERARNQGKTNLSIDAYQGKEKGLKRLFRFFFSLSLKRAHFVITPSLHLKSLLLSWGVKNERVVLVRNSTDTNIFAPKPNQEKKYDVITVCRLVPWKGVEEIIIECAKKGLSLAVVGDGPDDQRLKDIATQTLARVDFLGNRPHTELPHLLNSARIFVLNSQYEGSPHSLIEAMSVGLVSIAHASTGSIEVIDDKFNGLLCGQQRSLGEALSMALADLDLCKSISSNARQSAVLNFDREKNFEKILEVIEAGI
jgi:glycosyltransferase involved in cell wall biosynthesis